MKFGGVKCLNTGNGGYSPPLLFLLLSLFLTFGLPFSLPAQDLPQSSFNEQLQEAIRPLLSLPVEQRQQLAKILRLYKTELEALKKDSLESNEKSSESLKRLTAEVNGLKTDLKLSSEQLTALSDSLSEERTAHQIEVEAIQNREILVGLGYFVSGAIVAGVVVFSFGGR